MRRAARFAALVLLLAGAGAVAQGEDLPTIEITGDDTEVVASVRVRPGTYRVPDARGDGVLRIARDGVTVDLTGVTLVGCPDGTTPDTFEGVGVSLVGARDVVVRGGTLRGYRMNLRAERCPGVRLEGVDAGGSRAMRLRSTPEREDAADWLWPHENDALQWETRYGAGLSLTDCPGARVEGCRAQRAQNGLLLTRCLGARVEANDFSWNSGWGIALWRTCRAVVASNRCDWCVRGYGHGRYARGQDSAGILVFEQCSDNRFWLNSATHSGDGFFLYAGHETTQRTGEGGSNRNVLWRNDFSWAVANGIEATFSVENEFLENRILGGDHGVWAGYSSRTRIEGNVITGARHGVSIEHGQENAICENRIQGADVGVHLWWDDDKDLLASAFGRARPTDSRDSRIEGNVFLDCARPWRFDGDRGTLVLRNRVATRDGPVEDEEPDVPLPARVPEGLWNRSPPFLEATRPVGMLAILVDEWGPVDPLLPRLFPERQVADADALVRVLGPADGTWDLLEASPEVTVETGDRRTPGALLVRPRAADGAPAILPFRVRVRVGGRDLEATGTLSHLRWDVAWWAWAADPREGAAAWERTLAGPRLASKQVPALDWAGSGSPAQGVPADRFVTVATTTLRVPQGRYRFRILSDDGVRLLVDGKKVFEDWTWHGPKEDVVETDLSEGAHEVRVEHFEIDGYAALRCSIEPAPAR